MPENPHGSILSVSLRPKYSVQQSLSFPSKFTAQEVGLPAKNYLTLFKRINLNGNTYMCHIPIFSNAILVFQD